MRTLLWCSVGLALAIGVFAPMVEGVLHVAEVTVRCVVERGGDACREARGWQR